MNSATSDLPKYDKLLQFLFRTVKCLTDMKRSPKPYFQEESEAVYCKKTPVSCCAFCRLIQIEWQIGTRLWLRTRITQTWCLVTSSHLTFVIFIWNITCNFSADNADLLSFYSSNSSIWLQFLPKPKANPNTRIKQLDLKIDHFIILNVGRYPLDDLNYHNNLDFVYKVFAILSDQQNSRNYKSIMNKMLSKTFKFFLKLIHT